MYQQNYGSVNPYFPYNPYTSGIQQQQQRVEIIRVNGEGGARAFDMPPNSSALLLDETAPLIWLKTTDGAGYPNLKAYCISERKEEPAPDFKSLEERISRLEGMISESHTSDVKQTGNKQHFKQNSGNSE